MHNNCSRYLIFFQYIGTKYSGVVKTPPYQAGRGVQNYLEDAVQSLKPVNPVSLYISSRTDAGVHALSNSAHFDLQRRNDKPPFAEDIIVEALNFHLKPEQIRGSTPRFCDKMSPVLSKVSLSKTLNPKLLRMSRVTRAYRVPGDFHSRFCAVSRTYVYRIATGVSHHSQLPLTDSDLCWAIRNRELDVEAMRKAAALLVGTHDFSSFRALNNETAFKNPVKTLDVARIEPGTTFAHTHFHREIQFWELTFKSRSFLYKQVRRMTGALVAVGLQQLSVPQLKELLEARDSLAYTLAAAPALGLFLTRVDYRETDLQPSQQPPE